MFAKTQNTVSMILGVALSAATFAAPAFAGELSHNERAAQSAIVATESAPSSVDASPATLSRNESLAQRVIVDVPASTSDRTGTTGEATLAQNEIAAQRAIADATATATTTSRGGVATVGVAATRSPNQH